MRDARQAAEAGRDSEATSGYEAFLVDFSDDALAPLARLELGRLHLAAGRLSEARGYFEPLRDHEDVSVAERAAFHLGVTRHLEGAHEEALRILRPFLGRTVDPEDTELLLQTIATAADAIGDIEAALLALDSIIASAASELDRRQARVRVNALVTEQASREDVISLYRALPRQGVAWPVVARRAAQVAFDDGDMGRVLAIIGALTDRGVELDEQLRSLSLRARRTSEVDPTAVGAILPLEGRGAEVGRFVMRGLMLASGAPSTGPASPGALRLVFRNDSGNPAGAIQAVNDLVTLHRVIAIIGPVGSRSSRAAAARAQELGVPLVAFAPSGAVESIGPMTFRYYTTPRAEARALVASARARGVRRVAVLSPESPFGGAMATAFQGEAEAAGIEVSTLESYAVGTTAFGAVIAELAEAQWEGLFVPDGWRTLSFLAPAMAAAGLWGTAPGAEPADGVRSYTLLAPGVAYHPELIERAGRYLQGSLFALAFNAAAPEPSVQAFVSDYHGRFGETPDTHAAYAYDVFQILAASIPRAQGSRAGLAEHLASQGEQAEALTLGGGFAAGRTPRELPRVWTIVGEQLVPASMGVQPANSP